MRSLFTILFVLTTLSSAWADEPIVVEYGNEHLSAIYHSKEFDLLLEDGRLLKATKNGTKLSLGRKAYTCDVTRFEHYWGSSEMAFQCGGRLRSDNIYIHLAATAKGNKIKGFLLIGPNEEAVQVELNWMEGNRRRRNDSSVSLVRFRLQRHQGWTP